MSKDESQSAQQRALALFVECLEKSPETRSAWLDEACAGQVPLRAMIERLLVADANASGFLEQPPPGMLRSDRRGERLGPFELLEPIGAGGMGQVFRARRVAGGFQQEVAIKLFAAGYLSDAGLERFHNERQILACLEHPGIARVIDGGNARDGTPYIAMELVRGRRITDYCDDAALDLRQRLRLFCQVCKALQAAHQRAIVHRDIKPDNILVDTNGQPRIIDFGIAKVLDADLVGLSAPSTMTQLQLLTPEYASPEQVRGQSVGPSSDVYSLGALLYELLTGSRPYNFPERSPVEIERTVCLSIPADPSTHIRRAVAPPPRGLPDAGPLRRLLRGDLDRIVLTALRKEPTQRYVSAAALAEDIERYLDGQPVLARGATGWYRLGKFVQRNRAASLATATVFMVLLAALIAVSMQAKQARLQADRAEAAKDFLIQMISQADPYQNAGEPTMASALHRAIPEIDDNFSAQPQLAAELRFAVGFALEGLGEAAAARTQLELALDYFRAGDDPLPIARTLTALGRVQWADSDYSGAQAQFEQAISQLEGLDNAQANRYRYDALADLGGLLPETEQYQRAEQVTRRALALQNSLPDIKPKDVAVLWNNLGLALDGNGDLSGAIAAYQRSIELHRQYHPAHPDLATALGNLGLTLEIAGDLPKAVAMVTEAAAMQEQVLGAQHPQALMMRYNLGSLQINAGSLELALENLKIAVAGAQQAYAPNHLYTGRFNHRLAEVLLMLDRREEARAPAQLAASIYAQNPEVPQRFRVSLQQILEDLSAD